MNGKECSRASACVRIAWIWALMLCIVHLTGVDLPSQVNTGTLSGEVTDSTGAVVPGATLDIKDNNAGYTRQGKTSADGNYVFPDLPIGQYTVTVEASGFEKQRGAAIVNVGVRSRSDFRLTVGSTGQTIEVSASESALFAGRCLHRHVGYAGHHQGHAALSAQLG